jgi:hypothetical protein
MRRGGPRVHLPFTVHNRWCVAGPATGLPVSEDYNDPLAMGVSRTVVMRIFTIAAVLAFGTPALAQSALTQSGPANDSTHGFFVFDAEAEQWDHRTSF